MEAIVKGNRAARFCLVQPVDKFDAARLDSEFACLEDLLGPGKVLLAAYPVKDWNGELSLWPADGISARFDFTGGAPTTLHILQREFLPLLEDAYLDSPQHVRFILGGYSLAGLFSLWAGYQTDRFSAIAAASPSVWFPGWMDYASAHPMMAHTVYLSLGKQEERVRHPLIRTVGDCIREQRDLLADKNVLLRWEDGNHFKDPDLRTAAGFAWCVQQLEG